MTYDKEVDVSEDSGTERSTERPGDTEPKEQVVGDDESGYGGAGASDGETARVDPEGENRPPSEQDEDQGV